MNCNFRYLLLDMRTLNLIAASLLLCLFLSLFTAEAFEVVVKDSDIKPYNETVEGFKSACGCTVREFVLSDTDALESALRSHPSAIVAVGTESFRKIRRIKSVPVIYAMVIPSEIEDLSPNNLSGVSMEIAPGTYIAAIAEVFPTAKRVGVLFDTSSTDNIVRASSAARDRGITLVSEIVNDPRRVPELMYELRNKIDVLWLPPNATITNPELINYLMLFSFQHNLPIFSFSKKIVLLGAVAALIVSPNDIGAQAGEMTQRLLRGVKGPLREYANKSRLVVNRTIAAKIGVMINDKVSGHVETVE
jgi:putative ABC transport system substrate-binding protein